MHARRIRPDTGYLDRRRLLGAGLSAVLPGLGQLYNGRRRLAAIFLIPSIVVLGVIFVIVRTQSPTRLAAWVADPAVLSVVLTLNLVILVWRLLAVGQAFLDTRWQGPTGRLGIIGVIVIGLLVALPQGVVWRYGTALGDTFEKVFTGSVLGAEGAPDDGRGGEGPAGDERINVLLIGVDNEAGRTATLTDTMMVVSMDPLGETISMLSLPRDLVNVPLGNGNDFGPKLNSLMSYAERNPDEFPDGGMAALEAAIGALLGIDIHYNARIDFYGFVDIVDAVGGVDVKVKDAIDDPDYPRFDGQPRGWSISAGQHHLDGVNALAYARSRKAVGESDFTRAARQQQILVALRDAVTKDGSLLWELPQLLDLVGDLVTTNIPVDRLPALAAVVDEIGGGSITRAVLRHPLVASKSTRYGSSLVPDIPAIQDMARKLFPLPGGDPLPWPTPKPTKEPAPTASP